MPRSKKVRDSPQDPCRISIRKLPLSAPCLTTLEALGVKTAQDLMQISRKELSKLHAFDRKCLIDTRKVVIESLQLVKTGAKGAAGHPPMVGWVQRDAGPSLPEQITELFIDELSLSTRSYNALKRNRINTLGQLMRLSDEELLKFHAFGRKCLLEVRRAIASALAGQTDGVCEQQAPDPPQGADVEHPQSDIDVIRSPGRWEVPRHVTGDLDAPVDVLDLSTRASNILNRLEIRSVQQLLCFSKEALFRTENMGRKSLAEIQTKLFAYLTGEHKPALLGTKAQIETMLAHLSERQRSIVGDRYGLWDGIAETLQDIGDKFGVTRERIRQIEEKALKRLKGVFVRRGVRGFVQRKVSIYLTSNANLTCGIISEDEAIEVLADDCPPEEAALAVGLLQEFEGQGFLARDLVEAEPGVYCVEKKVAAEYVDLLFRVETALRRHQKPVPEQRLCDDLSADRGDILTGQEATLLGRLLTVSPSVLRLRNGTIAFSSWTEFRRRDAINLAEATLRMLGRQAHFRDISERIGALFPEAGPVSERTVHNALIQNPGKFVWVAQGTYGLAAWGLKRPPFIKDRLVELLSESSYPLPYWHLKQKVLEVCNCRESSVRMTLNMNPKLFKRFEGDQYALQGSH